MNPTYRLVVIPDDERLDSVNAYIWAVTADIGEAKWLVIAENADDAIHIAVGRSGIAAPALTVKRATFADLDAVIEAE